MTPLAPQSRRRVIALASMLAIALSFLVVSTGVMAQLTGAIFTTNSTCDGTNVNIYDHKADVYLDGGPTHPGAAGLPPGEYYVQVTEPNGTLLGTSLGTADETPVVVNLAGEFVTCYQLTAILRKASDSTPGYDTTSNNGGEYKVWISTESSFTNSNTKTDNFKVNDEENPPPPQVNPTLRVRKYYDANANGMQDGGEVLMNGWQFRIQDGFDIFRFTPVNLVVAPDTYSVTEVLPIEPNWINTDPGGTAPFVKMVTLAAGDDKTVNFGNVCLGPGGGMTLGFWSNKNGLALITSTLLCNLNGLNLRNANGTNFDPVAGCPAPTNPQTSAGKTALKDWLLSGNAVNMAYMLSVQLSAMELNVYTGKVNGGAIIYAPGLPTVAPSGFASVNTIMSAANTELGLHPDTTSGTPGDAFRAYQEALKNALDRANNNLNFVQATPCAYSY